MNRLVAFMSADNQTAVLADYTLVDKNSVEYAADVKLYPVLATEPVYVLKSIDKAEITKLNPIMGKALLVVSSIEQALADPGQGESPGAGSRFRPVQDPGGAWMFLPCCKSSRQPP